jgi:phthiodiolone/phenolphthiodiolone dimycocerosates ketoreductase
MALLLSGNRPVRQGFRFGILDGIVNSRLSPTILTQASYLTAAATGADSFWVGDHLNAFIPQSVATPEHLGVAAKVVPQVDAVLEPWTMLGHLAARNRIRRLRLGICVTDASRRNPAVTAQAAATLHLLTRGRAMLGIGVGEREGNEPYGVKRTKPVAELEEAIATIRALWDSAGELVTRDSPYFPLRNATSRFPFAQNPSPGQQCMNWHATATDANGRVMTCTHLPDSGHIMYWEYGGPRDSG